MFSPSLDAFRIWKERAGASNAKCHAVPGSLQTTQRTQPAQGRTSPSVFGDAGEGDRLGCAAFGALGLISPA